MVRKLSGTLVFVLCIQAGIGYNPFIYPSGFWQPRQASTSFSRHQPFFKYVESSPSYKDPYYSGVGTMKYYLNENQKTTSENGDTMNEKGPQLDYNWSPGGKVEYIKEDDYNKPNGSFLSQDNDDEVEGNDKGHQTELSELDQDGTTIEDIYNRKETNIEERTVNDNIRTTDKFPTSNIRNINQEENRSKLPGEVENLMEELFKDNENAIKSNKEENTIHRTFKNEFRITPGIKTDMEFIPLNNLMAGGKKYVQTQTISAKIPPAIIYPGGTSNSIMFYKPPKIKQLNFTFGI